MTVVTDGTAEVSKDDAVESLGDKASKYIVEEWSVEGEESSESESEEKKAA